jgi:predicted metal-binding membrane protein
MALLFVGGIMNLLWVAGLAAYVALEKLTSGTAWLPRAMGAALCAAGLVVAGGALK